MPPCSDTDVITPMELHWCHYVRKVLGMQEKSFLQTTVRSVDITI